MLWLFNLGYALGETTEQVIQEKRGAGSGAKKLKRKKYRWVSVGGKQYKVQSAYEEHQLVQDYVERKRAELQQAQAATEQTKARYLKVSLAKANKRLKDLEISKNIEEEERRIERIQRDDEDLIMLLANM